MVLVIASLLLWMLGSLVAALLIGRFIQHCDIVERARSVEAVRAMAQHPSSHAA